MSSVTAEARASGRRSPVLALAPGLAITGGVAVIAYLASHNISFLKNYQMIMAIILGAFVYNVVGLPAAASEGVTFSLRRILRFSIVLLGLQITAQQAAEVGAAGIAMIAIGLLATLIVTVPVGRLLGVPHPRAERLVVDTQVLGHRRIHPTRTGVVQRDGVRPELGRVLRRPQRELLFFGSSRSNDQG